MPADAVFHDSLWSELPTDDHEGARAAMQAILGFREIAHSPQVDLLVGSQHGGSFRLRHGRYRILFFHAAGTNTIHFTTAFLKRRMTDYAPAIGRHDARVQAKNEQGFFPLRASVSPWFRQRSGRRSAATARKCAI